jgi:DNA repair protein RecN (Recombination protein N)
MLRRIRIQNHALIFEAELHLEEGFHVFTGETGSGKSILLGAVGLLLGDRAETSGVGLHGDRAVVEGDFSAPQLEGWLRQEDLPVLALVSVRREVLRNGRSRVFINDAQASVNQLRQLGSRLVDIHRQDQVGLALERAAMCDLLDAAGGHGPTKGRYAEAFAAWTDVKSRLDHLEKLAQAPSGDVDYLRHQIRELESLRLEALDWDELTSELSSLQHAAELHSGLARAWNACDSDEQGVLSMLEQARKSLTPLTGIDRDVDEALGRIESVRIEMRDLASTLEDLLEQKQPDPERLQRMETTHDLVMRAFRKHGVDSVEELLKAQADLVAQADTLQGLDTELAAVRAQERDARKALNEAAADLTEKRRQAGVVVSNRVLPMLGSLKMPHANMTWEFPSVAADSLGMDSPEVWFSSNPGSPLLPLTKVASGGERSRFMLALKSVLAGIQSTPVVILDEIDTGVSGEVASHMGAAMKNIALSAHTRQVLAVTHLPQVAARAEHHWEVSKSTDGATTHVNVAPLDAQGRQKAIASMLSGENVTEEAILQAARLMAST